MKVSAFMCVRSERNGFQKPSMLATTTGFCVAAELHPGELLDELLERADAAGERHKTRPNART